MIDRNRLAETFQSLVSIDSVSQEEGRLARELAESLAKLGAETRFDTAVKKSAATRVTLSLASK